MTFSASSNTNKAQETENVAQLRMHLRLAGWAAEEKTLSEEVGQFCLFISVSSISCQAHPCEPFRRHKSGSTAQLHSYKDVSSPLFIVVLCRKEENKNFRTVYYVSQKQHICEIL